VLPLFKSNYSLTYIDHGDVDTTFNYRPEGELMNVPLAQGHQYTQSDTTSTSSNSELSIPPRISWAPAILQFQEQRTSRGLPQQKPGKVKGPAPPPSRSPRRPTGARGARNGPYLCDVCDKPYTQRQGVGRHRRETHDARSCNHCDTFKWGRPYLYKKHLQKEHSDVDLNATLDEITGAGRM